MTFSTASAVASAKKWSLFDPRGSTLCYHKPCSGVSLEGHNHDLQRIAKNPVAETRFFDEETMPPNQILTLFDRIVDLFLKLWEIGAHGAQRVDEARGSMTPLD